MNPVDRALIIIRKGMTILFGPDFFKEISAFFLGIRCSEFSCRYCKRNVACGKNPETRDGLLIADNRILFIGENAVEQDSLQYFEGFVDTCILSFENTIGWGGPQISMYP